jgi:hypothetical protein
MKPSFLPSVHRLPWLQLLVLTGAIGLGPAVACAPLDDTTPLPDGSFDDFDGGALPDTSATGTSTPPPSPTASADDAGVPQSLLRLAHLLGGGGNADVCVRASASAPWTGPLLSGRFLEAGIGYGSVSSYVAFSTLGATPGSLSVRLVRGGASCDAEIASTTVTAAAGAALTVVAAGDTSQTGDGKPRVVALVDTTATPAADRALLRTFHGVFDTSPIDVVLANRTVTTGVRFGTAGGFPYTAAAAYATLGAGIVPVGDGATMLLRAGTIAATFALPSSASDGPIAGGRIADAFALGRATADTSPPLAVLLCTSPRTAGTTLLGSCTSLARQ